MPGSNDPAHWRSLYRPASANPDESHRIDSTVIEDGDLNAEISTAAKAGAARGQTEVASPASVDIEATVQRLLAIHLAGGVPPDLRASLTSLIPVPDPFDQPEAPAIDSGAPTNASWTLSGMEIPSRTSSADPHAAEGVGSDVDADSGEDDDDDDDDFEFAAEDEPDDAAAIGSDGYFDLTGSIPSMPVLTASNFLLDRSLDQVPTLVEGPRSLVEGSLSPTAGGFLSLMDGRRTLRELVALAGHIRHDDIEKIVVDAVRAGLITLQ
jgi:hypothetical protein